MKVFLTCLVILLSLSANGQFIDASAVQEALLLTFENYDVNTFGENSLSPAEDESNVKKVNSDFIICDVSSEFEDNTCIESLVELNASPSNEGGPVNATLDAGWWIINGHIVTKDDEGTIIGSAGQKFEIVLVEEVQDSLYSIISVEFKDPGVYDLEFYVKYSNCMSTINQGSITVNDLPSEVIADITTNVCYNEDVVIELSVPTTSVYFANYKIGAKVEVDTFSSSKNEIIVSEITDSLAIIFNELQDTVTKCKLETFENKYRIVPFDSLSISKVEDFCLEETSEYYSIYEISGGSEDYELSNLSLGGFLDENQYTSDTIQYGVLDTLFVDDKFCQQPLNTFYLTNSCECNYEAAQYLTNIIYEACESDNISLTLDEASKSPNILTETVIRTYDITNFGIEFIDEIVVEDDSFALIPFNELYLNGKNYFARSYITSIEANGVINYKDYCIDSMEAEIAFRFYRNPASKITGDTTVCKNQSEVLYQPTIINSNTSYTWQSDTNIETTEQGNLVYVKFLEFGTVDLTLNQIYSPGNGEISCYGEDQLLINVTEDIAPERSDIFLFEPNLLSLSTVEDYCFQWFAVEKETEIRTDFGTEKQWQVTDFNPNEFFYGVETKFPNDDGICIFDGYCETTQFFNKGPIVGISEDHEEFTNKLKLFPNPTNAIINLSYDDNTSDIGTVNLYNILGEKLTIAESRSEGIVTIDVSHCQSGIYYIVIFDRNQENKMIQKVIIE